MRRLNLTSVQNIVDGNSHRYRILLPFIAATSLMASGCSLMQSTTPLVVTRYNAEGTPPPERMEQFKNPYNGNMVYRFCVGNECPMPTPKRPAIQRMPSVTEASDDGVNMPQDPVPIMVASKPQAVVQLSRPATQIQAAQQALDQTGTIPIVADKKSQTVTNSAVDFIADWAKLWSGKEADAYFTLYARNFLPNSSETVDSWSSKRRSVMLRPGKIIVSVSAIKAVENGNKANIRFWQTYDSNSFHSRVLKAMELVREDGAWKIRREQVIPVTT